MSTSHGEKELQKPISEYAKYLKNLLPVNIPKTYALKPMFENVAEEKEIRAGVIAFRDFMGLFFDCLILEGHLYVEPKKTNNPTSYPFLHSLNQLLVDIGYHGKRSESGDSLLLTEISVFRTPKPSVPVSKQMECLRFLTLCGFVFQGIDLEAKRFSILNEAIIVSYPKNPIMLTGLKALAIADIELRPRRYSNDDNLLRCDYRLLKVEDMEMLDLLKDFLQALPENLQQFALDLHARYTTMGLTCTTMSRAGVHFAYAYLKNSRRELSAQDVYEKRVWKFSVTMKEGHTLVVRAKKTDSYSETIEEFPMALRTKIAEGYGCDRKLRNEPCQMGCQGIRLPFNEEILAMKEDIVTWLDCEMPSALTK